MRHPNGLRGERPSGRTIHQSAPREADPRAVRRSNRGARRAHCAVIGLAGVTNLLLGFLATAFVLTDLRLETGFIVVEPWQIVTAMCLTAWVFEVARGRRFV